ncbi:MAG: sugar transferase [Candidatus Omnitrophica bacterium]|nr:sugar transferase [Candidatus Omnitrophota bacterium]
MVYTDLLLLIAVFLGVHFVGYRIHPFFPLHNYLPLLPVYLGSWLGFLYFFGAYQSKRVSGKGEIFLIILKAGLIGVIAFTSFIYIFRLGIFTSRVFTAAIFSFGVVFLALEKILLSQIFKELRRRGFNWKQILIVGSGERAQKFLNLIEQHAEWGLRVLGIVDRDPALTGQMLGEYQVVGSFEDLPDILHDGVIDEVAFIVPRAWLSDIEALLLACESEGVTVHLAVDYFELHLTQAKSTDFGGFPLLTFGSVPDRIEHLFMKRIFDIGASTVALALLSPLFLGIALCIKYCSKGPILFRQTRCGLAGRRFTMYKFRTMVEDAESRLEELMEQNEMEGPVFKMEKDPRLTPIGSFLRKTSLDELPQLINVLRGDMSLVGPRPPLPSEVDNYESWQRRRLSIRPGITCIWQANGRNRIQDFGEWVKLDLEYIDTWSLWLDFKILLRTIPSVLFGDGAK